MEGPNFHDKTVLVNDGAGFIGSHFIDYVLQKGSEKVVTVDNFISNVKFNVAHLMDEERFEMVEGDITGYEFIKPYMEQADYVINEAASKMFSWLMPVYGKMRGLVLIGSERSARVDHLRPAALQIFDSRIEKDGNTMTMKNAKATTINLDFRGPLKRSSCIL